jgi:hypothetical protein
MAADRRTKDSSLTATNRRNEYKFMAFKSRQLPDFAKDIRKEKLPVMVTNKSGSNNGYNIPAAIAADWPAYSTGGFFRIKLPRL